MVVAFQGLLFLPSKGCFKLPGKGIWFAISGCGTVKQGKVELGEEQRPHHLPGVKPFSLKDVLQIFVIGPDVEQLLSSQHLHSSYYNFIASSFFFPTL